jgi:hypothetical protein
LGLIKDKFQNLIKAVQQDIAIFAIKPVPVNSYHGVKSSLFTNDSQKKYADLSNCAETFLSVSSLLHLIYHFLEVGYLCWIFDMNAALSDFYFKPLTKGRSNLLKS